MQILFFSFRVSGPALAESDCRRTVIFRFLDWIWDGFGEGGLAGWTRLPDPTRPYTQTHTRGYEMNSMKGPGTSPLFIIPSTSLNTQNNKFYSSRRTRHTAWHCTIRWSRDVVQHRKIRRQAQSWTRQSDLLRICIWHGRAFLKSKLNK